MFAEPAVNLDIGKSGTMLPDGTAFCYVGRETIKLGGIGCRVVLDWMPLGPYIM